MEFRLVSFLCRELLNFKNTNIVKLIFRGILLFMYGKCFFVVKLQIDDLF
jgi:hypothetical protein